MLTDPELYRRGVTVSLDDLTLKLTIVTDERSVVRVDWGHRPGNEGRTCPVLDEAEAQIKAYFAGELTRFDLPLSPAKTDHGRRARAAMLDIAYGQAATYEGVAQQVGSGPRAIGNVCRLNPLTLIVPCHRVWRKDGSRTGYSGGWETQKKLWKLEHRHAGKCVSEQPTQEEFLKLGHQNG